MPILFTYLLEASACLIIFYAFYYFILKNLISFEYNRFYFLLIYFLSFLIPAVSLKVFPIFIEQVKSSSIPETESQVANENNTLMQLDISSLLMIGYYFIVTLFIIRLFLSIWNIINQVKVGNKTKTPDFTLVRHDNNLTFSFFKYLFAPKSQKIDDKVIAHELVHIKQWHSLDIILAELVKAVLWFNPIAYVLQNQIKLNHEFICDASAAQKYSPYYYAKFLSESISTNQAVSLVSNFSFKIKSRITMLEKSEHQEKNKWRYLLIIPMIGLLTFFFSCDHYIVQKESTTAQTEDSPYKTMTIADTVLIFNPDTGEEETQIVKRTVDAVERFDTTVIFDSDTYEETVEVVKTLVPIEKLDGKNEYDVHLSQSQKEVKTYGVDTLTVFDSETYEETVSIVNRSNPCYTFLWGSFSFAGTTEMRLETIQKFIFGKASIFTAGRRGECDEVASYSFRAVVVPTEGDPKVWMMNQENSKILREDLPQAYLKSGTKIFIEDILVNSDYEIPSVVIKIR
ncbi:MAG: hypothetical protein KJN84_04310 [Bacteroidia bacterium]|nr:hypothetical protein [Bacteroidia bacterium]